MSILLQYHCYILDSHFRHVYNYCTSVHQQSQSRVSKHKKVPNQGGKMFVNTLCYSFGSLDL